MIQAWHFVSDKLRDGRDIPNDGEWLIHDGNVEMCVSGLHASKRIIDALRYAPGFTVCRVECDDIRHEHNNKFVCSKRRILWRLDAKEVILAWSRRVALDVIHMWNAPDVVRTFLETGADAARAADAAYYADDADDAADAAYYAAAAARAADAACMSYAADAVYYAAYRAADAAYRVIEKYETWLIEAIETGR